MDDHNIAAAADAATGPAPLIDIGINLAHDSYDADRAAVLSRARDAGVVQLIVTGSSLESSARAIELARAHPGELFATAGVHPHHAAERERGGLGRARSARQRTRGGRDWRVRTRLLPRLSPPAAQQAAFHRQLELARALGKPVFLHQREAHADFVAILREHGAPWRGVAHCFTGDAGPSSAPTSTSGSRSASPAGSTMSGAAAHLLALMPQIPAARLLLETDGPYLLPRDLKPKPASRRNEPAYLPHIARAVARARGERARAARPLQHAGRARAVWPAGHRVELTSSHIAKLLFYKHEKRPWMLTRLDQFITRTWDDSIIEQLTDYVRIPNKSPMFDPQWEANGTWSRRCS